MAKATLLGWEIVGKFEGWSAGSFDSTYGEHFLPSFTCTIVANNRKALTKTPTESGSNMQDTSIVKACLAR
jgi:hypothetical protein